MKKIYLTEDQLKQFVEKQIFESIFTEKKAGSLSKKKLGQVTDYLANKARNAGENDDILHQARANGINIDSLKGGSEEEYNAGYEAEVKNLLSRKNEDIKAWVGSYLGPLRKSFASNKKMQKGYEEVSSIGGKDRDENGNIIILSKKEYFDTLDKETQEEVWKLKDFLDKEGLTFLYRKASKPSSIKQRYGLTVNSDSLDWNTPINVVLGAIDFSAVTDEELRDYYTGTRVKWINDRLRELGYDVKETDDGKPIRVGKDESAWEEAGKSIALAGKMMQVAERYVQRKYGMAFTFGDGDGVFSFGNKKIDNRTVIINFQAALRCPAWNRCLLKDACYARNTEKNYDNSLNRNLRTNLIWEQTRDDEQLTELMLELIRSYIFNYRAALFALNKKGYRGKFSEESLSKYTMADLQSKFGDEVIETIKETRRADVIRLNEDGDFIGQWLVDVWDKWAEDFKIAGVVVAAYTCRALNYEKISNMIINVSQEHLVSGQKTGAVAHFFYAVEPEEYNELKETYMKVTRDPMNGIERAVPSDDGPSYNANGQVTPMYRRLIDENGQLCGYYYKCPCGRMDAIDDTEGLNEAQMPGKEKKVDCYRCRICYGRDADTKIVDEQGAEPQKGVPVYVLVSVHGANKGEYEAERNIGGKKIEKWLAIQAQNSASLMEDTNDRVSESDPVAIKQVVKNTVDSVTNMMRNSTSAINEQMSAFYNIFDRISKK